MLQISYNFGKIMIQANIIQSVLPTQKNFLAGMTMYHNMDNIRILEVITWAWPKKDWETLICKF